MNKTRKSAREPLGPLLHNMSVAPQTVITHQGGDRRTYGKGWVYRLPDFHGSLNSARILALLDGVPTKTKSKRATAPTNPEADRQLRGADQRPCTHAAAPAGRGRHRQLFSGRPGLRGPAFRGHRPGQVLGPRLSPRQAAEPRGHPARPSRGRADSTPREPAMSLLETESHSLADRILDCFPSGTYAFSALCACWMSWRPATWKPRPWSVVSSRDCWSILTSSILGRPRPKNS